MIQRFVTSDSVDRTLKCNIHWKAVQQYFTAVLLVNPLTPRGKPWVIQSFLTFDSMNRTLKCDHSFGKLLSNTLLWCGFTLFVILENPTILNLALSGVKGLMGSSVRDCGHTGKRKSNLFISCNRTVRTEARAK